MKYLIPALIFSTFAASTAFAQQSPSQSDNSHGLPPPSQQALVDVLRAQKSSDDDQITLLNAHLLDFNQTIQQLQQKNTELQKQLDDSAKSTNKVNGKTKP